MEKSVCNQCVNCRGNANSPGYLKGQEPYCEWCEEAMNSFMTEEGCYLYSLRPPEPDPEDIRYLKAIGRGWED